MLVHSINKHRKTINKILWLFSACPALYLLVRYVQNELTQNPFEYLIQFTGHWAIVFFLLSFAITPVRRWLRYLASNNKWSYGKRLTDWNFLIYHRRLLGLCSFYYACIHFFIYLNFELDFDWNELYFEITERVFITLGLVSWLLLLVLALTSPDFMQKRLKKNWRTIHKLVYLAAPILLGHIILEAKMLHWHHWNYLILLLILLFHRIAVEVVPSLRNKADNGMFARRKHR